jgi:hypothetical protein
VRYRPTLAIRSKHLLFPCFDQNTCQNDLNLLTQHQGGKFWPKPNS